MAITKRMSITDVSIIHHVGIVLALLWILSSFSCCHPVVYFISIIYLYQVHERYILRLQRKIQFEERKQANQRRVLSDSETVRWLNHTVEKIWPICMEQIASQKFLLPIIPWFFEKFKPWTAKKAVVQHLYLGRTPPMFKEIRVHQSSDDDHLVLELGMNFLTADDMSAILAVKLRKRLGFGMWAKLHLTGIHVEGKIFVGVKFLPEWPYLARLRVCFVEPPYFQMTVKPIFNHGLDVTEVPGIAGWLDKLLAVAFEQTLVEPNMLVVDVEKLVSAPTDSWFSVDEKVPIAYASVEILEGADMKPSDLNGLADPYVKGQLGPYRFRTKTQKRTLTPIWQEEYKIAICTWESPNLLSLEVRDKDHFRDDTLGDCSVNISKLRDGQRHEMWLPLQNVKMGRLHLAITVHDISGKGMKDLHDEERSINEEIMKSFASETAQKDTDPNLSSKQATKLADKFEPINIEGKQQTGIWVHHPGSDVSQNWEPRKGRSRTSDTKIYREDDSSIGSSNSAAVGSHHDDSSSNDENLEGSRPKPVSTVRRSLQKISSVFQRSPSKEDSNNILEAAPTHVNFWAVNDKETGVKLTMDENIPLDIAVKDPIGDKGSLSPEKHGPEISGNGSMKCMAKSILKQAGRSAQGLKHALSRKGSKQLKGELGLASTETDNQGIKGGSGSASAEIRDTQGFDSSDEDSLSSSKEYTPILDGISTDSTPILEHCKGSPNLEKNVKVCRCDAVVKPEEPPVKEVYIQAVERTDDDRTNLSDMCGKGLVQESLNPKLSEGNLEAEK